jgi:phosphate-selective porin
MWCGPSRHVPQGRARLRPFQRGSDPRAIGRACAVAAEETRRQTWHVDVEGIERVKEAAEAEWVSQAEIVDRAFRQFFA